MRFIEGLSWVACSSRFVSSQETAKWPEGHAAYCKAQHVIWPVRGSAYCQSPETLGVLAPHIAVLPDRESDLIKVVDMIMTAEHERGSGLHDGAPIYVDGSQALGRQPWSCSILGCILPGSKFIDLQQCRILSGSHCLRLQGCFSSLDMHVDFSHASDPLRSDMAGNAMSGHCFANVMIAVLGSSATKPKYRISSKRSRTCPSARATASEGADDHTVESSTVHAAGSGLGVLFDL